MSDPLVEATSLATRFLDSITARQDLAEHLDCYHPDAWVLLGDAITKRRDLTSATYLEAMRRVFARHAPGHALPVFEAAGAGTFQGEGDEGMLLLPLEVHARGLRFTAAFHLALAAEGWKVLGCLVASEPAPTLRTLAAMTAAELALAREIPEPGEIVITPLDLAFLRIFPSTQPPLLCLPETRFTCQNTGRCCSSVWRIAVPGIAQKSLSEVNWSEFEAEVPARYFEADPEAPSTLVVAKQGLDCVFRHAGGCTLHATVGYAPLSTCAAYPLGFTETPEGLCLWTSFTCPTVRSNLGSLLTDQEDGLRQWFQFARKFRTRLGKQVSLQPEGPSLSFAVYRAFEEGLLEILKNEALTPRERAQTAAGSASLLRSRVDLGTIDEAEARRIGRSGKPISGEPPRTREGYEAFSITLYRHLKKNLPAALKGSLAGLSDPEKGALPLRLAASEIDYLPDEALISHYLRQIVFRKWFLKDLGLVGHVHMLVWVEALVRLGTIALAYAEDRRATTRDDLEQSLVAVEESVFHSDLFSGGVVHYPEVMSLLCSPQGAFSH